MVSGQGRFFVALASLLAVFSSALVFAKSCTDDDRYTLYFYGDSDAKVLRDQQLCPDATDAKATEVVNRMECRCFEMKYQDVLKKLSEGSGPVAVSTKKLSMVFNGVSCRNALNECEKACQENQRQTASNQQCDPINVAGIAAQ